MNSERLQVVITGPEARLFTKWCKERGFVKKDDKANFSSALAYLIRRTIDRYVEAKK
jgi:hypothetical protein